MYPSPGEEGELPAEEGDEALDTEDMLSALSLVCRGARKAGGCGWASPGVGSMMALVDLE